MQNQYLLIVPYGIETWKQPRYAKDGSLLIVPYGIETMNSIVQSVQRNDLLIVPYGIETCYIVLTRTEILTFNRTLWN